MKVNFQKSLVVAGIAAALAGASTNSVAAIYGDAGEAVLVPFAVWGDLDGDGNTATGSQLNTFIQVTVPSAIGGKTIPNVFTANNTTPNNAATPPGEPGIGIDQTPFQLFLTPPVIATDWGMHWYFMSYRSIDLSNGVVPITPEDHNTYTLSGLLQNGFENEAGYLLLTTQAGAAGNDANYAFFADAYLTANNVTDNGGGVFTPYSQIAWEIPTVPMADGADTPATIRPDNHVVQVGWPTGSPHASPLYSAIPTGWNGATLAGAKKVIDLAVGDRSPAVLGGRTYNAASLLVVWNDRNAAEWGSNAVSYDLFNDVEVGCSGSISLPNEQNLVWFALPGAAVTGRPVFLNTNPGVPALVPAQAVNLTRPKCGSNDSFIRFQLPLISNDAPGSAAFAFSLQSWISVNYWIPRTTTVDNQPYPQSVAHDRGAFQSSANKFNNP